MSSLVMDLLRRVEKLEKDNIELKKWANKERKKINPTQWLNEHYFPTQNFEDWVKNMNVYERDLCNVFEKKTITGIYDIIMKHLRLEERQKFPIIFLRFPGGRYKMFIYSDKQWKNAGNEEIKTIIKDINLKLWYAYRQWEKNYPLTDDCDFEIQCIRLKKMRTITLTSTLLIKSVKAIKSRLRTYLQLSLKNIVEYEFVF